ncbi:MAG: DUF393 domain-containing protein [Simkaniaceae bacterium]
MILFDDACGLCQRSVCFLLKIDSPCFFFSPLSSKTSFREVPKEMLDANSLVLVEDYKGQKRYWIYGKAFFRIFWLLGKGYALLGLFHFLPKGLIDPLYRFVARNRSSLHKKLSCKLPKDKRFLP